MNILPGTTAHGLHAFSLSGGFHASLFLSTLRASGAALSTALIPYPHAFTNMPSTGYG